MSTCQVCGVDMPGRGKNAKYCAECGKIIMQERVRAQQIEKKKKLAKIDSDAAADEIMNDVFGVDPSKFAHEDAPPIAEPLVVEPHLPIAPSEPSAFERLREKLKVDLMELYAAKAKSSMSEAEYAAYLSGVSDREAAEHMAQRL